MNNILNDPHLGLFVLSCLVISVPVIGSIWWAVEKGREYWQNKPKKENLVDILKVV